MTETLQLDEVRIIELHDAPKLLIEWSPRWEEFVTSIGPAFARSGPRLAGEAPYRMFPYRGMLASFLLELFFLFVLIVLPRQISRLRPYAAPKLEPYQVIYYSGDELPRTEDLGGAQSGATGHSGGREAHHRTQTIRVARGGSLAQTIVDAPDLKLPSSSGAVANLLAFKSKPADPGPNPSEGLRTTLSAPSLPPNVVAPATLQVTRDQLRSALGDNAVVPPAPTVSSSTSRSAALNAAVVPPAPGLHSERSLNTPSLNPNVIAPASARVSRDQSRSAPAINASVIPPAPTAAGHEVAPSRIRMNTAAVVPPPVSAPARDSSTTAKLTMPAPTVIAPPPTPDSSHDLRRVESGGLGAAPKVVPPPPSASGSGSFVSSIIGKLFGTQDVVPPPPNVSASSSGTGRNAAGGSGGTLAANVVPPPPSIGGSPTGSGAAPGSNGRSQGSSAGTSDVVPPPPSVSGSGTTRGGSPNGSPNSNGSGNGTLAANVVPPPPSVGSGPGLSGSGRKGSGLGGPGDAGSVLAPPKGEGGSNAGSGVVLSSEPGANVGKPGSGGKGSLAMSPSGGDQPGLGGSGGGPGIGHGNGPGSGMTGTGPGAGKTGTGVGSDPNAHGGISPTPGPGGAGSAPTGAPAVPGVDVRGGSTSVVNLPSFGSDSSSSAPTVPGRSSVKGNDGPAITIVATSRSGGAFDFYGKLPGDNYTVYVDTAIGTVVMQFAEANPGAHSQAGSLTGPQGLRTDLPKDLPRARIVIKCRLDASGNLGNFQVLEPGPADMTAKIMAALPSWKFRPATRGAQPVAVDAILGFNIDTNDRN